MIPECCNQAGECQVIATGDLENAQYDEAEIDGIIEVILRCLICGAMDVWYE